MSAHSDVSSHHRRSHSNDIMHAISRRRGFRLFSIGHAARRRAPFVSALEGRCWRCVWVARQVGPGVATDATAWDCGL